MSGNFSGGHRHGCLMTHMRDYDRLPPVIKRALQEMSEDWNGSDVYRLWLKHGTDMTMAVLAKTERDAQAAYVNRIAA